MKKVNFLTFFWGNKYTEEHVNILYRALKEYCDFWFEFHVLADRPLSKIDKKIHQYELWHDYEMEGRCWRRLRAFNKETMSFLPHYFALDVDVLIMPKFPKLVKQVYGNDFTICRSENPHHPKNPYSGTMWQVGKLKWVNDEIWKKFLSLKKNARFRPLYRLGNYLRLQGYNGSDSAVIGYCLQDQMVKSIGAADGIYSYPHHIKEPGLIEPPENAKAILFHGKYNDYLKTEMAARHKFVNDYLKKFCTSNSQADTIESMASKHFGDDTDSLFMDKLKGFTREILNT